MLLTCDNILSCDNILNFNGMFSSHDLAALQFLVFMMIILRANAFAEVSEAMEHVSCIILRLLRLSLIECLRLLTSGFLYS